MSAAVGIFVHAEAEVLDCAGLCEALTMATQVYRRVRAGLPEPFRAFTLGRRAQPVKARAGLGVRPDFAFDAHAPNEVLVVAGAVVRAQLSLEAVYTRIARGGTGHHHGAGLHRAFLPARAGVLDNPAATTHCKGLGRMQTLFPAVETVDGRRWIDDGPVVASAGINRRLHLVERPTGRAPALRTVRQMDFDWRPGP
jgi:transcriptional regulator GlxA family with amidase domain